MASSTTPEVSAGDAPTVVCLAGDVMTGRGVDQILPVPGDPELYEAYVRDARQYVELAERRHGPIPRRADPEYVWGDVVDVIRSEADASVVNLETAVTDRGDPWPSKGIHYRMNPANVDVLAAAGVTCCTLANNHALDWSTSGLVQTLEVVNDAGISTVGAGRDERTAWAPALIGTNRRVAVIGLATPGCGVPPGWKAGRRRPGLAMVERLSGGEVERVGAAVEAAGGADVVIVSIHWGPNWGYTVPDEHRRFAHRLIDEAVVDVVHGHSSHHPLGIEVYQGKPIFFGCGDLLTDYEGIRGHDEYRPGLGALYLVTMSPTGGLARLELVPTRVRRMRLERAHSSEAAWLAETLSGESAPFGVDLQVGAHARVEVRWDS